MEMTLKQELEEGCSVLVKSVELVIHHVGGKWPC